ncbi:MAG: D-alanyl-D-alanine carboxypeptidase [Erysipelotrichales bacterium]|nr:D-alanyl-D-alanine carboxypeptidase [Erysipelotrichales bacterium]
MKKILLLLLSAIFSLNPVKTSVKRVENTNSSELGLHSSSVVLIEPVSKKVIYEVNKDEKHFPASMTKMMGMYLVLTNIENGKMKWTDMVETSEYASSMGGTQIYLEPYEKMSVEDMFKAVCINSANDAITALGEHIAGSTPAFVELMNKTAKKLGMLNTNFMNPTGFDDENHYTTPYDMALVASELVKFDEELFRFTRLKEDYIRKDTSNPFWLVNTNKMLGHYDGLDGLKTGFTNKANYNLTATAKRNGIRLISVVMNEATIAERSQDTTTLLNYGFANMQAIKLFDKDQVVTTYDFQNSLEKKTPLIVKENIIIVVDKNVKKEDLEASVELTKTEAPVEEGECVGNLVITTKSGDKYIFKVYTQIKVNRANFFDYFIWNWLKMIF